MTLKNAERSGAMLCGLFLRLGVWMLNTCAYKYMCEWVLLVSNSEPWNNVIIINNAANMTHGYRGVILLCGWICSIWGNISFVTYTHTHIGWAFAWLINYLFCSPSLSLNRFFSDYQCHYDLMIWLYAFGVFVLIEYVNIRLIFNHLMPQTKFRHHFSFWCFKIWPKITNGSDDDNNDNNNKNSKCVFENHSKSSWKMYSIHWRTKSTDRIKIDVVNGMVIYTNQTNDRENGEMTGWKKKKLKQKKIGHPNIK